MSNLVTLSKKLISDARTMSKVYNRPIADQIEYWAKIGKIAEDNPNLTFECIKDILIARVQADPIDKNIKK